MTMEITETKEAVTKAPYSAWVGNLHAYTEGKTEGRWILSTEQRKSAKGNK